MNRLTNTGQLEVFGEFAKVYDRLMNKDKYVGWGRIIEDVVKKYSIPRGRCLDIACGTGVISGLLLKQGFGIIGLDISDDMIKIARVNYPKANFIEADIRDFNIEERDRKKIVMAVSFYDSLNYLLSDEDMLKMFESVARNLPDETIFLFDMNTRDHVSVFQQTAPKIFEDSESYITLRYSGEGRLWVIDIDFFLKQPGGLFERHKEHHVERGYDEGDIAPMLKKTGFNLLEVRKENKIYEDGKEYLSRLYFVARKGKDTAAH
ncbi:MAG: class I SAM-dependent methyltransferase [bacterium]